MARFSQNLLGEEGTQFPAMTGAIRGLYSALKNGHIKEPEELSSLGTNVTYTGGIYQLVGSICFIYLSFSADTLTWSWASGPLLSLPISTQKQSAAGDPGGYIQHGSMILSSSTSGTDYQLRGKTTTVVGGDRYSIALAPNNATPVAEAASSDYTISGWYWIFI